MTEKGFDSFTSIPAVKAAFSSAGNPWFSPGAMRFFNSTIESSLIGGRYFITSERMEKREPKLFTIRKVVRNSDGSIEIETISEFQEFKTEDLARKALKVYRESNND
jgi:hypothetical protein